MIRGRLIFLVVFGIIAVLVIGGLGWTTRVALQLEHADNVRIALWRLDSRVFPAIAREDGRPVSHYEPIYPPLPVMNRSGNAITLGNVLVPSPLLSDAIPDWIALHFVIDSRFGWRSPQVLNPQLTKRLQASNAGISLVNATPTRAERLQMLMEQFPLEEWFPPSERPATNKDAAQWIPEQQRERAEPQIAFQNSLQAGQFLEADAKLRSQTQSAIRGDNRANDPGGMAVLNVVPPWSDLVNAKEYIPLDAFRCSMASIQDFRPMWKTGVDGTVRLLLLRRIDAGDFALFQGILVNWPKLRETLVAGIREDMIPDAELVPDDGTHPDRMASLPVRLKTGDPPMTLLPLDSPLRIGLAFAWAAAIIALAVVAFGGWSLLDLSERRFRFVSAVTHELRTPLTTLRLYLDMLTGGLIKDDSKKQEYLTTLHGEADRLNRLITNVLDYARLERQRPVVNCRPTDVLELAETLLADWRLICESAGKKMELDIDGSAPASISTDPELLRQLLGNLIDNACKYSRQAEDPRLTLQVRAEGKQVTFAVEDRGPGIREGRAVFSAFRRGADAPATSGGIGLGLALADRWAKLLGGELRLISAQPGARFEFVLNDGERSCR